VCVVRATRDSGQNPRGALLRFKSPAGGEMAEKKAHLEGKRPGKRCQKGPNGLRAEQEELNRISRGKSSAFLSTQIKLIREISRSSD
jgi:hypothetical protein